MALSAVGGKAKQGRTKTNVFVLEVGRVQVLCALLSPDSLELDVLFRSDFCEEAGRSGGSGGEASLGNPAPVGRAEVTLSSAL